MKRILAFIVIGVWATAAAALPFEDADAGTFATSKPAPSAPSKTSPADKDKRCKPDGSGCIHSKSFIADVCTAIEREARANDLDPHFLARLLWRESLFDPSALSPAGAQGIAQFMPGTARIVGLRDPWNPAEAIAVSARYLAELSDRFGGAGMAAVAYNGGETRAANFRAKTGGLAFETQDYVLAITGLTAEKWRDNPPKTLDLRLDKTKPFHPACVTLAGKRRIKEFATPERSWPWGVVLAVHSTRSGAQKMANRLTAQLRPALKGKRVGFVRRRLRGSSRKVFAAQIGWDSRSQANAFCAMLRSRGGKCVVLKN